MSPPAVRIAIRFMGEKYIDTPAADRTAYIFGAVSIGDYSFIGTSSVILPGTKIGRGCIIGAGSVVKGNFEDYSVIVGNPAKVVDDSRNIDKKIFSDGISAKNYYDPELLGSFQKQS